MATHDFATWIEGLREPGSSPEALTPAQWATKHNMSLPKMNELITQAVAEKLMTVAKVRATNRAGNACWTYVYQFVGQAPTKAKAKK